MSELNIRLKGWQAGAAIVVLGVIVVLRLFSLNDMSDDKELMEQINALLMNEYAPYVSETIRTAYESGEKEKTVQEVLSTKVNIISVQASYPVLDFSVPKDVVIKVVYSLDDMTAVGEPKTIYYLFKKGVFGWQYKYITTSLSYYLNFS